MKLPIALLLLLWLSLNSACAQQSAELEGNRGQRAQIDAVLAKLKLESFDQSVEQLIVEQSQYLYGRSTGLGIDQLETMLANRRVLKVIDFLEHLSPNERDAKCGELFQRFFQIHTNTLRVAMRHVSDPTAPDNNQNIENTKYAMGALMFVTAQAGQLEALKEQFRLLDAIERVGEAILVEFASPKMTEAAPYMRGYSSLDSRAQVNLMLLAAASAANQPRNAVSRLDQIRNNLKTRAVRVVPWDAKTTFYEQGRVMSAAVDESKGVTKYVFYDWKAEMLFEPDTQRKMIQEMRGIVFR